MTSEASTAIRAWGQATHAPTAAISFTSPAPIQRNIQPGSRSPPATAMPSRADLKPSAPPRAACIASPSNSAEKVSRFGMVLVRTSARVATATRTMTGAATQSGAFMDEVASATGLLRVQRVLGLLERADQRALD